MFIEQLRPQKEKGSDVSSGTDGIWHKSDMFRFKSIKSYRMERVLRQSNFIQATSPERKEFRRFELEAEMILHKSDMFRGKSTEIYVMERVIR